MWCVALPVTLLTLGLVLCQQGNWEARVPLWALLLWNAPPAPQSGDPHSKGLGFVCPVCLSARKVFKMGLGWVYPLETNATRIQQAGTDMEEWGAKLRDLTDVQGTYGSSLRV